MPRGGLSSDPEKRARQLAGLQKGNQRAAAKLSKLGTSPAAPTAEEPGNDEPALPGKPGRGRVPVGKVEYAKPGKAAPVSPAKKRRDSQAKKPRQPGKDAGSADAPPSPKPGKGERLPGFFDGLQLPRFTRRD